MPLQDLNDKDKPLEEPISQDVLDQIAQDAQDTITAQAEQVSEQYTAQQQEIDAAINEARRRKENRERLPDYGAIAPGELRAFGAYAYDYMFEDWRPKDWLFSSEYIDILLGFEDPEMEVFLRDPEFLTGETGSVWQALRNEPGIVSALLATGLSEDQALGILFALDETDETGNLVELFGLRPEDPCFKHDLAGTEFPPKRKIHISDILPPYHGQLSTKPIQCEGDPRNLLDMPYPELRRQFIIYQVTTSPVGNIDGFQDIHNRFDRYYAETFQSQQFLDVLPEQREEISPPQNRGWTLMVSIGPMAFGIGENERGEDLFFIAASVGLPGATYSEGGKAGAFTEIGGAFFGEGRNVGVSGDDPYSSESFGFGGGITSGFGIEFPWEWDIDW